MKIRHDRNAGSVLISRGRKQSWPFWLFFDYFSTAPQYFLLYVFRFSLVGQQVTLAATHTWPNRIILFAKGFPAADHGAMDVDVPWSSALPSFAARLRDAGAAFVHEHVLERGNHLPTSPPRIDSRKASLFASRGKYNKKAFF